MWHDQHLLLEGPIVRTLEAQFADRWIDTARTFDLSEPGNWTGGQIIFSSGNAFDQKARILPLDPPLEATLTPPGGSTCQLWRTIPWRHSRTGPPFARAEFTVMAGYAHAMSAAKEFIWIFDQYFWSLPLARLLNARVREQGSGLCVAIILPPYADSTFPEIHRARQNAIDALTNGLDAEQKGRVAIYNLWHPTRKRGIYCHAKTQTYDGSLLVCGSANLNRRSLTCDSEIACAVLDPVVVADHQRRLWELLFWNVPSNDGDWPGLDLDQPGNGRRFFAKLKTGAGTQQAFLTPDDPTLPNKVVRPISWPISAKFSIWYTKLLDPSSIDKIVETPISTGLLSSRPARLDEIVDRIERTPPGPDGVSSAWRHQAAAQQPPDMP